MRPAAKKDTGDTVAVRLKFEAPPRILKPPAALVRALRAAGRMKGFLADTPSHRKEIIRWVCPTKNPVTRRLDPREPAAFASAHFGNLLVTADDHVFADDDGAVFVPRARLGKILQTAHGIWATERAQADGVRTGRTLGEQLRLADYLKARPANPALTFRQHLRGIRGAIEE